MYRPAFQPRRRIGAQFDQNNRQGPGAPMARPPIGLTTGGLAAAGLGADRSAFDASFAPQKPPTRIVKAIATPDEVSPDASQIGAGLTALNPALGGMLLAAGDVVKAAGVPHNAARSANRTEVAPDAFGTKRNTPTGRESWEESSGGGRWVKTTSDTIIPRGLKDARVIDPGTTAFDRGGMRQVTAAKLDSGPGSARIREYDPRQDQGKTFLSPDGKATSNVGGQRVSVPQAGGNMLPKGAARGVMIDRKYQQHLAPTDPMMGIGIVKNGSGQPGAASGRVMDEKGDRTAETMAMDPRNWKQSVTQTTGVATDDQPLNGANLSPPPNDPFQASTPAGQQAQLVNAKIASAAPIGGMTPVASPQQVAQAVKPLAYQAGQGVATGAKAVSQGASLLGGAAMTIPDKFGRAIGGAMQAGGDFVAGMTGADPYRPSPKVPQSGLSRGGGVQQPQVSRPPIGRGIQPGQQMDPPLDGSKLPDPYRSRFPRR